jgi:hypothetical protein
MKPLKLASILMVPVAGTICGYGTAAASTDGGNSRAAHGCLPAIQNVTFTDGTSRYFKKVFQNHGDCTSAFAMNKEWVFVSAVAVTPGDA